MLYWIGGIGVACLIVLAIGFILKTYVFDDKDGYEIEDCDEEGIKKKDLSL